MARRLNLLAPQVHADPYPFYAELRRTGVCQVDPGGMWAVSRHDDAVAVLRDTQHFSSSAWEIPRPQWLKHNAFGDGNLVGLDPPVHTKLRGVINASQAFGPAGLARLEPLVRSIAEDLAGRIVGRDEVEFMEEFAMPLPERVMCHMLGLAPDMQMHVRQWAADTMLLFGGTNASDQIARIRTSLAEMEHYFTGVVETRRSEPKDDMVSNLIHARADGHALSQQELFGFFRLLLVAGMETTVHLLGNAMVVLSSHPHILEEVVADRHLIPAFTDELLRYESPAPIVFRRARHEARIGATPVPERATILVILASAQRDERYYPQGDQFVLGREKQTHLSFGHGIHFCVGAALARMELRASLEAILPRIRVLSRPQREIRWLSSLSIRGPKMLPIHFEPI